MKKFFSSFGKWIAAHKAAAISVAAVAVAAVVGVVLVFALKPAISDPVPITAEITPTVADADGVFTESQFLIAGERFADKEDLLSQLSAGVDTPFDVQKTEQGNYLLTFEEPLEPDAILTFMIDDGNGNDRSYAFQTRAEFGVRSFFPRNGASADPTTGIEITFTNANFTDYESYITVEPATPYRMEKVGDRVVIIPEKRWEEMTTYVVTVRAGLTDAKGESIAEDASAEFSISEDVDKNTMIARSGSLEETFLTTDVPVIEMIADTHSYANADFDYSSAKFDVVVHKVASADAYADLLRVKEAKDVYRRGYYYASYMTYDSVDTAGMEQTLKATLSPIPYEAGSYSTCYLVLPQTLPEGYYVVTATTTLKGTPYTIQKLIQVNDTVVYMRSESERLFVWVNDAKTATSVSGATVTLDGEKSVKTGSDGTAELPISGKIRAGIVKIENGSRMPFIASIILAPEDELPAIDKYYAYIYTDRESYLPTDKIRVFGVLRGRYGAALPDSITVAFGDIDYYFDYAGSREEEKMPADKRLISVTAQVDAYGVFTAELPLDKMEHAWYSVAVVSGDDVIRYNIVEVEDYVKPAYTVTFDEFKTYYKSGETVKFGMTAEYYGGIPAAGERFSVDGPYYVTDAKGRIERTFTAVSEHDGDYWHPSYKWISVKDESTLDKVNEFGIQFCYLPKSAMLTGDASVDGNGVVHVNAKSNYFKDNLTKEAIENCYSDPDGMRGAPYVTPVAVKIDKITYDPPTEYTYYDYVAKKTITTLVYSYNRHSETVFTGEFDAYNGVISEDINLEPVEGRSYYEVEISIVDDGGRKVKTTLYTTENFYDYHSNSNVKHFSVSDGEYGWWDYTRVLTARKAGETVQLDLLDENSERPEGGTLMLGVVNAGVREDRVYTSFPFELKFEEKYAPNVYLFGAYFDGQRIYKLSEAIIPYDYSEKKLDIGITTDKEEYKPGEEITISVTVKDGKGAGREASVNVSVVDEAQFAVSPQNADLLGGLYGTWVESSVRASFVSFTQHAFNGDNGPGGEGGGGEDQGTVRQNFVDNAAFETVRTDKNGKAQVTFTLPDNVTDWRITVNALTDDLYGGSEKKNVSASLPFVTDAIVAKTYQSGDDVSFGVHAYGTGVAANAAVEFTATLTKPDGSEQQLTQSAKGNAFTYFNFGQMPAGEYSVTVSGKSGSASDAIKETFTVVKDAVELPLVKRFDLASGIDVNALRSPVTLVFSNGNAKYIASTLYGLYFSAGGRTDQHIAASVAGRMLASFAPDDEKAFYDVPETPVGEWQNGNGGVAIYSYADTDPFVTAFAVWADRDAFDAAKVRAYANGLEDNEKYLILAALGDPVLIKVQTLLAEADAGDVYSRMLYACALAALGDDSGAEAEFTATFRPLVAESALGSARIVCGDDEDINDKLTAMALTIASRVDRPLAMRLMQHVCEKEDLTDFYGLQQVIYARNMLRGAYGTATFEYSGGTVTLEGTATKTLKLTVEDLAAAGFAVKDGTVDVTAYYTGAADELDVSGATYTVTKTLEPVYGGSIAVGDRVRVEIDLSSIPAKRRVEINDYIPSGFRFIEYSYDESDDAWLCDQDGQRIRLCAWSETGSARAVFYVRAVTKGTFAVSSAYVCDSDENWGMSARSSVTVQ